MLAETDSSTATIFVSLLNEGTPVWRPVLAERMGHAEYRLIAPRGPRGYDPEDEEWEFEPGTLVICEERQIGGEMVKVAVRRAD